MWEQRGRKKIGDSNCDPSAVQPVASRFTDYTPAHMRQLVEKEMAEEPEELFETTARHRYRNGNRFSVHTYTINAN
jgi:hypothetical protein